MNLTPEEFRLVRDRVQAADERTVSLLICAFVAGIVVGWLVFA